MEQILPFFTGNAYDQIAAEDYMISNVDAEGNIVPMYTNITLDHAYSIEDVVVYYHLSNVGTGRSTETHIFQISAEDSVTDTMEWVAVNDPQNNVFVPYYPMLTTDTLAAYQVSTAPAGKATEAPEAGAFYATTFTMWTAEGRQSVEGFCILPEDWAASYYWTVDVLSHVAKTEEQAAAIQDTLNALQLECYALADTLKAEGTTAEAATALSMNMASKVFNEMGALAAGLVK